RSACAISKRSQHGAALLSPGGAVANRPLAFVSLFTAPQSPAPPTRWVMTRTATHIAILLLLVSFVPTLGANSLSLTDATSALDDANRRLAQIECDLAAARQSLASACANQSTYAQAAAAAIAQAQLSRRAIDEAAA